MRAWYMDRPSMAERRGKDREDMVLFCRMRLSSCLTGSDRSVALELLKICGGRGQYDLESISREFYQGMMRKVGACSPDSRQIGTGVRRHACDAHNKGSKYWSSCGLMRAPHFKHLKTRAF